MSHYHLTTKNLSVGYSNRTILNDVNLTIPEHKISVILGANGCGKSTLLKTFARLLKPKSGTISLNDIPITEYPTKKLAQIMSFLPQTSIAPEGITVQDLLLRARFPYKKFLSSFSNADFDAVDQAMEQMNITSLKYSTLQQLSGGQQQRVWIAFALTQETPLLFLDEPTTYLDIAYQIEILDRLKKRNEMYGTTIVMVLHDINLSARYADHIFAVGNHQLIGEGTPSEMITPSNMKKIYGLDTIVLEDPLSHTPYIIPKSTVNF